MSAVVAVDGTTFKESLNPDGVTVVDFWAEWCGPCKVFAPIFAQSADSHPEVTHLKVNVDESPDLASAFGIMSIPTTVVMRDGQVVSAVSGAIPSGRLADLISEARG